MTGFRGADPYNWTKIYSDPAIRNKDLKLKAGSETLLADVEAELGCKLENVNWLPGFFAIASQIQIARSKVYCEGKIYVIDAASGAAVTALNVLPGDHILDLCAAPVAKLCMLAELLGSSGSLTGVDIAKSRLAACRTMLQKYALGGRCRLFVADGTTFSLLPLGTCTENQPVMESENGDYRGKKGVYQEWSSRVPWSERRKSKHTNRISKANTCELIFYGKHSGVIGLRKEQLFQTGKEEANDGGYDKVLVDAECTHDGSVKNILKFEDWGWDTPQRRLLDAERIATCARSYVHPKPGQLGTTFDRLSTHGGPSRLGVSELHTHQRQSTASCISYYGRLVLETNETDDGISSTRTSSSP
ncbi:uncharacterized protein LOC116259526 [Nymphaea colorata]|nr:uncharacterized protein LOC116259526 [Nymphaea colorata]